MRIAFLKDFNGKVIEGVERGAKCKAFKNAYIGSHFCRECRYNTLDKFNLTELFGATHADCTHKKNNLNT